MRFPDHENTPFDQETGLPEGWLNGIISEYGTVITGKTPQLKKMNITVITFLLLKLLICIHIPMWFKPISLSAIGAETQKNKLLPKNSVAVSCIGTAGVVALVLDLLRLISKLI